ncbi:hypothetical protein Tco_1311802 [Tanacetum coccineum]
MAHLFLSSLSSYKELSEIARLALVDENWLRLWSFGASALYSFDSRVRVCLLLTFINLLDHHRTVIRRYLETFLCLVGLSRSFDDHHVRPTLLKDNESDMGLLDYVKSVDPFKVKTRERRLAEGEIPLNDETVNMTVAPLAEIIQIMEHTIVGELREHAGKKKRKVAFDTLIAKKLRADRVAASEPMATGSEELISSSITPTLEPNIPEDFGSTQDAAVQTHRASMKGGGGVGVSSVPGNNVKTSTSAPDAGSPIDEFFDYKTVDTATDENIYVLEWIVTNGAWVDSPAFCRNLLDHITPPAYWAALRNQSNAGFLDGFNINSTQHICMVSELHCCLKAKLEKVDSEATEVDVLHVRIYELETRVVARSKEDAEDRHFEEKSAQLDARIMDIRCDMDNDLYPHMFTTIAGRRWVLSHILRLAVMKCAQSVECRSALRRVISLAIDKGIQKGLKNRYVVAVSDFENVSFTLLDELESLKDSPLASIMSALVLRDDQGNMPLSEVIPVISVAAERRGLCPPLSSTAGGVVISALL